MSSRSAPKSDGRIAALRRALAVERARTDALLRMLDPDEGESASDSSPFPEPPVAVNHDLAVRFAEEQIAREGWAPPSKRTRG